MSRLIPRASPRHVRDSFSSALPTVSAATCSKPIEHRVSSRPMSIDICSAPPGHPDLRSRGDREIDEASLLRGAINALAGLDIVVGLRKKDALHKLLRIAIVEREPARLDL